SLEFTLEPVFQSQSASFVQQDRPSIVLLGTSPVTVLEAIRYKKLGYDVTIYEKAREIGGSWRVIDLPHFREVPLGPHTIDAYPFAYEALRDGLRLELEPADGHWYRTPRAIMGHSRHDLKEGWLTRFYTPEQCAQLEELLEKRFEGQSYERVMSAMKRHNNHKRSKLFDQEQDNQGRELQFPVGGTVALVDSLKALLQENEVNVHCGVSVEDCPVVRDDGVEISLSDGTTRIVDQLVLNSRARFSMVRFGKAKFPLAFNEHQADMAWLVTDKQPIRPFRVELRRYPPIWRLSHVSDEARSRDDSEASIFTIAGHRDTDLTKMSGEEIVSFLVDEEILEPATRCLYYSARTSREDWISLDLAEQLEKRSKGKLVYLYTHNLGRALSQRADAWKQAGVW
ncbi:MAG: NAD(P)-binding protein, partial [Deltaproteobacteria bacterium]|nr:NAD(P)-binding protein [Deltaproteobacteria bacterium]